VKACEQYLVTCLDKVREELVRGWSTPPPEWVAFCESLEQLVSVMAPRLPALTNGLAHINLIGSLYYDEFMTGAATTISQQADAAATAALLREAVFDGHLGPRASELVVVQAAMWVARMAAPCWVSGESERGGEGGLCPETTHAQSDRRAACCTWLHGQLLPSVPCCS